MFARPICFIVRLFFCAKPLRLANDNILCLVKRLGERLNNNLITSLRPQRLNKTIIFNFGLKFKNSVFHLVILNGCSGRFLKD